jgi:hypothetical protein
VKEREMVERHRRRNRGQMAVKEKEGCGEDRGT